MAGPIDTPSTGEIWHLTIDDLLAPLPETSRLGGPGPFVINLSASSAPIGVPAKDIAGCQHSYLYQVQRTEDGRVRYRLRLGSFSNEDDADAALKKVRDDYPSALTATADADDLRAIATLQAKAPAPSKPVAAKPPGSAAPTAIVPPVPAPPVMQKIADRTPAAVPTLSQPGPTIPKVRVLPTTLAPSAPTSQQTIPVRTPAPAAAPRQPVAAKPAGTVTPTVASAVPVLTPEQRVPARAPAAALASAPTAAAVPSPAATSASTPSPVHAPSASTPRLARQFGKRVPDLETTQTVRALTQLELENDQASRWFAIQLSLSEEAFDPETVPNLDIFSVYRLYSVAGIDQGRIVHALRVGFFSEQSAAAAVASYLTAFYEKPSIKRVSSAERDRFTDHPLEPRKDVGATGKQAVIEITDERYIREKRIGQTALK